MKHGNALLRPGLRYGSRPEKAGTSQRRRRSGRGPASQAAAGRSVAELFARATGRFRLRAARTIPWLMQRLARLDAARRIDADDPLALESEVLRLRRELRRSGLNEPLTLEALSLIRGVVRQELGIEPHGVQLFAAWAMLHGSIVEMATGEGKTLTAAMVAICAALAEIPVHVLTVNDYLVQRDADSLAPLYRCFGLSTGMATATMTDEQRRAAYACDIVYCSSKQVVFDYLRDGRAMGEHRRGLKQRLSSLLRDSCAPTLLRGLCMAIVDEADSVLIDEARTPLILAQGRPLTRQERIEATTALAIARSLQADQDFTVHAEERSTSLTPHGKLAVQRLSDSLSGRWQQTRYRDERVIQALTALYVYQRDRHYMIADDMVMLIDESTGRTLPDRKLQYGIHQMLELKERCTVTDANDVAAALSFQRFFARYGTLCGMTGTVSGVRRELQKVYGVRVVSVPENAPSKRRYLPTLVTATVDQQMQALMERVRVRQTSGQPILIGTRTVALSEAVSEMLDRHGIPHRLLNARQDAAEAQIVARAGSRGAVTVATNMAGRGTDIVLGSGVSQLGGLHVINLEVNDSRRVDRQLFGRAARQGDPGSCETLVSLEDELLQRLLSAPLRYLVNRVVRSRARPGLLLARLAVRHAQRRQETRHADRRFRLFNGREQQDRLLALAGDGD